MDPIATLDLIKTCLADGEYTEAQEHAENLRAWVAKGGFEPEGMEEVMPCEECNGAGTIEGPTLYETGRCGACYGL